VLALRSFCQGGNACSEVRKFAYLQTCVDNVFRSVADLIAVSREACVDCQVPEKRETAEVAKQSETFVFDFDESAHYSSLTRTQRVAISVPGKLCVGCWPLEKREDAAFTEPSETFVIIFDRLGSISH
jgi:hypothetical protein